MAVLQKLFKKHSEPAVDQTRLPVHIAIIPDGNGRWAKKRAMPRNVGHREGANVLRKMVIFCSKLGIQHLTFYAFSTENWKRPQDEVDALMKLLLEFLSNAEKELRGSDVRIRVLGDVNRLSPQLQQEIQRVVASTAGNHGLSLNIALNYGGREELLHAIKEVVKDVKAGQLLMSQISEQAIADRLYTYDIPEPDLLIRTSGEQRISNFLLWQLAYTELWYTDALWPDFTEDHLLQAIRDFQKRNRRFGGI